MFRDIGLAMTMSLLVISTAAAEPIRFKFEKGQTLIYNVVQVTKATETIIDEKTSKPVDQELFSKHNAVRQWKVADVDDKNVATLEMTLLSVKWERRLPNGETEVFDSAKPDKDNMAEVASLIGPVLVVIRVDNSGKVVEVKEIKKGSSNPYKTDLPFRIFLPETGPKEGQTWDRPFTIKLDPPQGAGETYEATQKYTAKAQVNGFVTVNLATTIKNMPTQTADQIPLLLMLLEGDVYFHEATGRYQAARLKIKKELLNHAGEGTKYVLESVYTEDLKLDK